MGFFIFWQQVYRTSTTTERGFDPLHLSRQVLDPGPMSPLVPVPIAMGQKGFLVPVPMARGQKGFLVPVGATNLDKKSIFSPDRWLQPKQKGLSF